MTLAALFYLAAWTVVAFLAPALWPVALLGFFQNLSHTFVSRGRNSGSLGYHMIAAVFSNGIYISLLVLSISIVAYLDLSIPLFIAVYVLSTMSGSVFAHGIALRFEKGKSRNVQQDQLDALEKRLVHFGESHMTHKHDPPMGKDFTEKMPFKPILVKGPDQWAHPSGPAIPMLLNELLERLGKVEKHFSAPPAGKIRVVHGETGVLFLVPEQLWFDEKQKLNQRVEAIEEVIDRSIGRPGNVNDLGKMKKAIADLIFKVGQQHDAVSRGLNGLCIRIEKLEEKGRA